MMLQYVAAGKCKEFDQSRIFFMKLSIVRRFGDSVKVLISIYSFSVLYV